MCRVNGAVSEEAFMDYYKDLNATLPEEETEYFVDLVTKTWNLPTKPKKLPPKKVPKKKTGEEEVLQEKERAARERLRKLEDTMYEKLRQRTNHKEDESITLQRAARYVDIANQRVLNLDLFGKLLINIGCFFDQTEVKDLFAHFADENTGTIDPVQLGNHFALKSSANDPNLKPTLKIEAKLPTEILNKIRSTLMERGMRGVRELGRLFRQVDKAHTKKLTRAEFTWTLKHNGHSLSQKELDELNKYFDKDMKNAVYYNDVMGYLRGSLNERRRGVVHEVFQTLDPEETGSISIEDFMNFYNVEDNPKVYLI
jgi:Ca2+-binding EF-hand superfamily protein